LRLRLHRRLGLDRQQFGRFLQILVNEQLFFIGSVAFVFRFWLVRGLKPWREFLEIEGMVFSEREFFVFNCFLMVLERLDKEGCE
jgi:hypothetical protein